jgi:hypothetical protein
MMELIVAWTVGFLFFTRVVVRYLRKHQDVRLSDMLFALFSGAVWPLWSPVWFSDRIEDWMKRRGWRFNFTIFRRYP